MRRNTHSIVLLVAAIFLTPLMAHGADDYVQQRQREARKDNPAYVQDDYGVYSKMRPPKDDGTYHSGGHYNSVESQRYSGFGLHPNQPGIPRVQSPTIPESPTIPRIPGPPRMGR